MLSRIAAAEEGSYDVPGISNGLNQATASDVPTLPNPSCLLQPTPISEPNNRRELGDLP